MSALITTAILLLLALWAMAVYGRLLRLRRVVTGRWRDVGLARKRRDDPGNPANPSTGAQADVPDADRALERARLHYNLVAAKYNAAIASVPGSILAGLAGFKRAELLEPEPASGAGSPSA